MGKALGGGRINASTGVCQEQAGMESLIQQIPVGIPPEHSQRALPAPAPNSTFPAWKMRSQGRESPEIDQHRSWQEFCCYPAVSASLLV